MHSQQTTDAMCSGACVPKFVPDAMTAAMMVASLAAKRYNHYQHCNSCMLLESAGSAAGAGYNRSSLQERQDMKAFVKRLEQAELDKIQQRFQNRLQAAGVSYEVSLLVRQADQFTTYSLTHLLRAVWQ